MDDDVSGLAANDRAASPEATAKFKLLGSFDEVIGVFANYLQVVSFVVPALGAIVTAVEVLIDVLFHNTTLDDIKVKLDELIRFEHGFDQQVAMLAITDLLGPAEVDLADLKKFGAGSPYINVPAVITSTGVPEHELGAKDAYWIRPFFPELVYPADFWHDRELQPPTQGDGRGVSFVFDPRLALPAYCEAVSIRISARVLIDPTNFQADWGDEVDTSINDLGAWMARIADGLKERAAPSRREVFDLAADRQVYTSWSELTFGAVDIWDGTGIVSSYPVEIPFVPTTALGLLPAFFHSIEVLNLRISTGELRDPELSDVLRSMSTEVDDVYPILLVRRALGSRARLKALTLSRGLGHVWSMIQGLKRTRGRSDVEHVNRATAWSLREVHDLLGDVLADPDEGGQFVHVRAYDVARRLATLGGVSAERPLSLRGALRVGAV